MAELTIAQRIERIFTECSGVWGTSGVTSWEKDRLEEWRGLSSGLVLAINAYDSGDVAGELAKVNAELMAWSAMRKACRG